MQYVGIFENVANKSGNTESGHGMVTALHFALIADGPTELSVASTPVISAGYEDGSIAFFDLRIDR
jgi:hypothetical protein